LSGKGKLISLFLLIILLLPFKTLFAGEMYAAAGVDVDGRHRSSTSGITATTDAETGFSLDLGYFFDIHDFFQIGPGIEFQVPRGYSGSGKFSFLPVYLAARIPLRTKSFSPFLSGRTGYTFFIPDSKYKSGSRQEDGGFYYGFGTGILKDIFIIELVYSVHYASLDYLSGGKKIKYSKFCISAGINISL